MIQPLGIIYRSSKSLLSNKSYVKLLFLIAAAMFAVYIIIPVFSIPGNDVLFQLSIWKFKDYAVLIPITFLVALMITMQVYIFRQRRSNAIKETGKGFIGSYSGIVAGVFGTASCSACVAAIFGFLGAGGVLFLVKYQWYVVAASLTLVLLSIYLSSLIIQKNCEKC